MKKLVLIGIILPFLGCQPKVDTKAEGEKIIQISKQWTQIASQRDLEKTVSYWDEDAILISAGQPVLKGRNQIRSMVEESFKIPGFRIAWEPQSVVVSESGDMAYMIEDSQVTFPDSTGKLVTQMNKAVSIWRKQVDGSWKNVVDISTPDASQPK